MTSSFLPMKLSLRGTEHIEILTSTSNNEEADRNCGSRAGFDTLGNRACGENCGGRCGELSKMVDEVDERILSILREDSRKSFVEIAKIVNLSEAAIRRRVSNLIRSGVISRFTIDTNVGPQANAISLLSVNPSFPTSDVSARLKKMKGVDSIFEITGEYDVAVIVSGSNIAEINSTIDDIRKLQGIDDTNTVVVLKVVR